MTIEFSACMLAALRWTNQKIGKHPGIPASAARGYLAASFRKLDINKKRDFEKLMLE